MKTFLFCFLFGQVMNFSRIYILAISLALILNATIAARAFPLSSTVEAITIPSVGGGFQTVNFENSYTNAIPVCTYELPSTAAPPAVVRIQSIGSTSMQIRLQQPRNSATVTAGRVFCLVAEAGVTTFPNGLRLQAVSVNGTTTHGRNVPLGFGNNSNTTMIDISGSFSGFTNPIALGQVISFNDANFSIFHSNDCDNRNNPSFNGGFGDGICVTKHVGEDNITRGTETLGVIVIEQGSGAFRGAVFESELGPDTVDGVGNNGASYGLADTFEFAVATQSGEDGGDGGVAVFLGTGTVGGTNFTVAVDEDQLNDTERGHITERVAYFALRELPTFTAEKTVDRVSIAEALTLNYEIVLTNDSAMDNTGISLTDTLPNGSTGTVTGPTESITTNNILEVGETWTYTISYPVTAADILAGVDLTNNISVTSAEYTTEGVTDETALATTVILPANPSITVTKVADQTVNVAAGVTVTYTYTVVNNGNQFISNISLSDSHNGSGSAPVPGNEAIAVDNGVQNDSDTGIPNDGIWQTLAPGDEITFTATYIVTQNDVDTLQ